MTYHKKCQSCTVDFSCTNPKQIYCTTKCKQRVFNKHYRVVNASKIKERSRNEHLLKRYGITFEEKLKLLALQGGVCALCKSSDPGSKNGWSVDHDHSTEQLRGILCRSCNTLLGSLGDSIEAIKAFYPRILEYLCQPSLKDLGLISPMSTIPVE